MKNQEKTISAHPPQWKFPSFFLTPSLNTKLDFFIFENAYNFLITPNRRFKSMSLVHKDSLGHKLRVFPGVWCFDNHDEINKQAGAYMCKMRNS